MRLTAAGEGVAVPISRTRPSAIRAARFAGPPGSLPEWPGRAGMRARSRSPVVVDGLPWGLLAAAPARRNALPSGTGHRLAVSSKLGPAAIADAQAELAASRARIVAAADETRRSIERDLHEGAQRQLASLAVRPWAARAAVPPGLRRPQAELGRVTAGGEGTLDELRRHMRGIHPAILAGGSLAHAPSTLVRRSPLPAPLDAHPGRGLPEGAEATACHMASEAPANAAKHAGASAVHVWAASDVNRLGVRDDGIG